MAVVPFKNLSGSQDLNVIAATDEFIIELQQIKGLMVLPVDRVLAKLNELGMAGVESPVDAMTLADALGVDGIIVGSINRYQPYSPPLVSIAVELYGRKHVHDQQNMQRLHVDPADLSRAGKPYELNLDNKIEPMAVVVRVFDANQDATVERMKQYSQSRQEVETPLSWKKYMLQRNYLRFVSHEVIGELMFSEKNRLNHQM